MNKELSFPKTLVYLVGAGPGDPGLITVKGMECLRKADVIVFDRLVSRSLLNYVKEDAELIYAGKSPQNHTLEQEQINATLVAHAQKGKTVVRLKGGDPFVFGRGGEEAEYLESYSIPFEIVPGVTSAIAVPAYAGIPVTHRQVTSAVTIITGNESPGQGYSKINWKQLADKDKTLIFLMGMHNLVSIVDELTDNGLPGNTPVAVISWGTTPEQKTVVGTLKNIRQKVTEAKIVHPAIIAVGQVVQLRDKLKWFENKPLFGKRIVVTRPRSQATEFINLITDFGGDALSLPTIKIAPPADLVVLDQAISRIKAYDWLVFTSVNGVKAFFERLRLNGIDIRQLAGIRIIAIGPATKKAIEKYGLLVDFIPEEYRAEGIIEGLANKELTGKKILLPRANIARKILPEYLKSQGALVDDIEAYQTVMANTDLSDFHKLITRNQIDVITFTSSSTVRNFVDLFTSKYQLKLLEKVAIACIGPVTAATAAELGLNIKIVADDYTVTGLLEALLRHYYQ